MYTAIFILLIAIAIYSVLNVYIGKKIIMFLEMIWPNVSHNIFWIIYSILFLSFLFGQDIPELSISKYMSRIGGVYLGVFFYLLIIILIIETIKLILRITKIKSKDFFKSRTFVIRTGSTVTAIIAIITVIGLFNGNSTRIVNYDVKIDKTVKDMKQLNIVMISDIHMGNIIGEKRIHGILEQIKSLNPDILLIAGDIFDGSYDKVENIEEIKEDFKNIKPIYGTYACFGNHDFGSSYSKMVDFCKEADINLLLDEYVVIDDRFVIAGRRDKSWINDDGSRRKNMEEVIQDVPEDKPIIMLDHQPSSIEDADRCGIDLLLSGHTHKGQLFPGNLITEKLNVIDHGQYTHDKFTAIVSCGTGTWGPPMRIGSRSEITNITVTFD